MQGTMRRRRRHVWEITVSLGKDGNGIRRRRSRTVYGTKPEAQKLLRQMVEEVERKRPRQGAVLLGDWLSAWHREDV